MTKKEKEIVIAWVKKIIETFGYDLKDQFKWDRKEHFWTQTEVINAVHRFLKELEKQYN